MANSVQWVYWNQEAGIPKGYSKTHLLSEEEEDRTLCGIEITRAMDSEYGDGSGGYCKKCEKKERQLLGI